MSESILLYSSHRITPEELTEVIITEGGIVDWYDELFYGTLSPQKEAAIWLTIDDAGDLERRPLKVRQLVREKLGAEPQATVGIIISFKSGSQRLAVVFANVCANRWPCVVDNLSWPDGEIFGKADMDRLLKTGEGFIDYGM
jgi:hypothetical protein